VNKKLSRIIKIAKALKGEKQSGKQFHVSAAFRKNKIVGIAWNDYQQPNLTHRFGVYKPTRGGSNYKPCRHSETELLKKLRLPTKDLTFVNVRIGNNGQPMMAHPCPNCQRELERFGFKKLHYSITENEEGIIY